VQEICPLRSTWRGLESSWESASDVAGLSRMAPVLDPTDSAVGLQEKAPNHLPLLRSKAVMVSREGKRLGSNQVGSVVQIGSNLIKR